MNDCGRARCKITRPHDHACPDNPEEFDGRDGSASCLVPHTNYHDELEPQPVKQWVKKGFLLVPEE